MLPELEEAQRELSEEFRFWRLLTSAERTKENPRKLLTEAFPPCAMNESAWSNTVVMKVSGIESNRLRGVAMEMSRETASAYAPWKGSQPPFPET
jgi:hypothetical protein